MADYTQLTKKEVKELVCLYEIGELESISSMKGGQANSSFKLSTTYGHYILSVCDEKNIVQIDCLTQILEYLEEKKFPTSQVIRTRDKKCFVIRNNTPVYLKQYMGGDIVQELSPTMLQQVGKAMAHLHTIPPLKMMPERFPYGMESLEEVFNIGIAHAYTDWLKQKKEFLTNSIDSTMVKCFIHGDIFWDNLLFSKDRLVAVLDFEEACHYYKLFDIGMCAVGCCRKDRAFDMEKVSFLLKGYMQKKQLSFQEKKQLKIFMEYAAVVASFWRFRQYNIRYPNKEMAQSYEALSLLANHIHQMDEKEFLSVFTKK